MVCPPVRCSPAPALSGNFATIFDALSDTVSRTTWHGWVVLAIGVGGGALLAPVVSALLRRAGRRFAERGWEAYRIVFCSAARPVGLGVFGVGLTVGVARVEIHAEAREWVVRIIALLYIVATGTLIYNLVELLNWFLHRLAVRGHRRSRLDDQIAPLVRKTLRIFVVLLFALFAAQNVLKADIGAWLAGLGIAGLAVSLAAQDSIKNLFGSIVIFMDRPFLVGDTIQFDKWEGPVEEIGFRSTKLRTLGGEQVLIPNSRLADTPVVNLDRRSYVRRALTLTLAKDTPPAKVDEALAALRGVLAEPAIVEALDVERHPARVILEELSAGGPVVRVYYWFKSAPAWAYQEHAEQVNLRVLHALAGAEVKWG